MQTNPKCDHLGFFVLKFTAVSYQTRSYGTSLKQALIYEKYIYPFAMHFVLPNKLKDCERSTLNTQLYFQERVFMYNAVISFIIGVLCTAPLDVLISEEVQKAVHCSRCTSVLSKTHCTEVHP